MRVLVVDQDSALLEAIARSLRDRYTVDAVTNKGDCLDLLRQNTFEVIVAGERLEDGSGLELLSQCAKRWASMLRIFAADRPRLQLLKGRLGPFQLFQTLAYPIDPDRLLATLELAEAAQHANADTANIQHVVLGAEVFAGDGDESAPFPPPRPEPRVAPAMELPPTAATRSAQPARRLQRASSAPRPARFRTGTATAVAEMPELPLPEEVTLPRRNPVRFPPRIQQPSDAIPTGSAPEDVLAEAAELAREALAPLALEPHSRKRAIVITSAALALGLILVGWKLFGARPASPPSGAVAAVHPSPVTPSAQAGSDATPMIGTPEAAPSQSPTAPAISAPAVPAAALAAPHPPVSDTPRLVHHRAAALSATSSNSGTNSAPGLGASPPALPPETPVGLTMAPRETLPIGNTAVAHRDSSEAAASSGAGRGASVVGAAASGSPAASAVPGTTAAAQANTAANTPSNSQRSSNSDEPPPVIREAKLIHAVRADYPSAARRDGIEGYVELAVTVSAQGAVTDVKVSRANPPGVFDKAAVTAVRHYRYDPRYVDGLPAEAHLQVHLDFKPAEDGR